MGKPATDNLERYYLATQWQMMWRKFRKHKLANVGAVVLVLFLFVAVFCEFLAPHDPYQRYLDNMYCPPQRLHFVDDSGRFHFQPFVYAIAFTIDEVSLKSVYKEDHSTIYPIRFFLRNSPYKLWNLIPSDIHLFGVKPPGVLYLFGTDKLGRDLFSRLLYATRISLSVGLVGVALSFALGVVLGGISGYFGGTTDLLVQRLIEFLISIPTIPLWMALSASLPLQWSTLRIYFFITIILSIVGWCGLARVVRGKLVSTRNEDYVMAAKLAGCKDSTIIARHLLPAFLSYLIVNLTISVPNMILGETALSFLGLGLRPPIVSWGVMLRDATDLRSVAVNTWLLIPAIVVVVAVLAFNFMGDGLRDAADPYK